MTFMITRKAGWSQRRTPLLSICFAIASLLAACSSWATGLPPIAHRKAPKFPMIDSAQVVLGTIEEVVPDSFYYAFGHMKYYSKIKVCVFQTIIGSPRDTLWFWGRNALFARNGQHYSSEQVGEPWFFPGDRVILILKPHVPNKLVEKDPRVGMLVMSMARFVESDWSDKSKWDEIRVSKHISQGPIYEPVVNGVILSPQLVVRRTITPQEETISQLLREVTEFYKKGEGRRYEEN